MCYDYPSCHWFDTWNERCTRPCGETCTAEMDEDEEYGDGLTAAERARQDDQLAAWEEARDLGQI